MASGQHHWQQQKGLLESRIRGLVNDDLKQLCRAYGYQVSGTKIVLQRRCLEGKSEAGIMSRLKTPRLRCGRVKGRCADVHMQFWMIRYGKAIKPTLTYSHTAFNTAAETLHQVTATTTWIHRTTPHIAWLLNAEAEDCQSISSQRAESVSRAPCVT
jgi:hypothetical protein